MYDITKPKAPKMPTLGRGTECIKILLSQVSKDVREPHFRCFSPHFVHKHALGKISTFATFGAFKQQE